MHCGNLCKLASNFKIGAITSSTHAQKWSKAFGWISPQVMKFRKFSLGRGSGSRLTKNTPLLRRTHGQSVCVMMWPEKFWLITNSWGYPGKQNHNYYFLSLANFHTFGQAPLSMKLVINERCSSETVIRAHLSGFNLKLLRVNSAMKSILGSLLSPMINYIGLLVTTCQNDTSSHYIHDHSWEVQSNVKVQKVIKIQNIFSKHDKKWLRLLSILFIVTKPHSLQGKQKWLPNRQNQRYKPFSMNSVMNLRCSSKTTIRAHLSGFNRKVFNVKSAMKSIRGSPLCWSSFLLIFSHYFLFTILFIFSI